MEARSGLSTGDVDIGAWAYGFRGIVAGAASGENAAADAGAGVGRTGRGVEATDPGKMGGGVFLAEPGCCSP